MKTGESRNAIAAADRSFWLAVESPHNWQVDAGNDFTFFGLSRKAVKRAKGIRKGDLLIFYVSGGISCFSGVRVAEADDLIPLRRGPDYDLLCPFAVRTRPIVSLPRERWVRIGPIVRDLSFLAEHRNWGSLMRRALIPVEERDAALILRRMAESFPAPGWQEVLAKMPAPKTAGTQTKKGRRLRGAKTYESP